MSPLLSSFQVMAMTTGQEWGGGTKWSLMCRLVRLMQPELCLYTNSICKAVLLFSLQTSFFKRGRLLVRVSQSVTMCMCNSVSEFISGTRSGFLSFSKTNVFLCHYDLYNLEKGQQSNKWPFWHTDLFPPCLSESQKWRILRLYSADYCPVNPPWLNNPLCWKFILILKQMKLQVVCCNKLLPLLLV